MKEQTYGGLTLTRKEGESFWLVVKGCPVQIHLTEVRSCNAARIRIYTDMVLVKHVEIYRHHDRFAERLLQLNQSCGTEADGLTIV